MFLNLSLSDRILPNVFYIEWKFYMQFYFLHSLAYTCAHAHICMKVHMIYKCTYLRVRVCPRLWAHVVTVSMRLLIRWQPGIVMAPALSSLVAP